MDRTSVTEAVVPRWFNFMPGESTDETLDLAVLSASDQSDDEQRKLYAELEELLELRTASL